VPASLLAIVLATLVSLVLRLDVRAVGEIPRTLLPDNRLDLFSVSFKEMGELFLPAVSIAMLGMIESLLCGASAGRMTGTRLNSDQELVAQGIGNLLIPFFGGIPATAAIARTSVAIKSGARTRLAGIIHAVGLLLSMLLLAPLMSRIPLSALAGVLIVTAWRMNEWETIRFIFSRRFKSAILKFTATMAATVVFDLTVAILIGFLVALMLMVRQLARIEISTDKVDMSRIRDADDQLKCRYGNAEVVYISGPLLFAAISGIRDIPAQISQDIDTVLFSMRGVSHLDLSGAQALQELILTLRRRGLDVVICGVPRQTMTMMERSGLCDLLGRDSFYWSVERALLDRRPACRPEAAPAGS
jgi:SulP family sulfate permease